MTKRRRASANAPSRPSTDNRGPSAVKAQTADAVEPRGWQWLVLSCSLPVVLCAAKLNLDIWYDEAYTLAAFASRPLVEIGTGPWQPNNHILYTMLLRPFYLASDADYVLRLPSLLLSVGTLALLFRLAWHLAGPAAAVLATLTLGLNQMFLNHTMQLRGYGLSMLLVVWLVDLCTRPDAGRPNRRRAAIVLGGSALLYTLPTNGLFLAALTVLGTLLAWWRQRKWRAALSEALTWTAAWLLAAVLYAPLLDDLVQAQSAVHPTPWRAVVSVAGGFASPAVHDMWIVLALCPLGFAAWLLRVRRTGGDRSMLVPVLLLTMALVPLGLTAAAGIVAFPRNYTPWLPPVALGVGWLLDALLDAVRRRWAGSWPPAVVPVAGAALLVGVIGPALYTYSARLSAYRDEQFAQDGYFNYYAADFAPADAVSFLVKATQGQANYRIAFDSRGYFTVPHYMRRAGLPMERLENRGRTTATVTVYAVVPVLADWDEAAAMSGASVERLRAAEEIARVGYFRVLRTRLTDARTTTAASGR